MAVPYWIWFVFIFAFGCCIGSFLNVVIYRLPRDKSLVTPPSACPACGKNIRFYDNIPLLSWLLLGRKCRFCKAPISPRYFVIELLTALVFVGIFFLYFRTDMRPGVPSFLQGGWLIYLVTIIMLAAFIAASAIDLELWIIPVSICWFVTVVGVIVSAVGVYFIDPADITSFAILPSTKAIFFKESTISSLSAGATIGFIISMVLLVTGLIKRSYESDTEPSASEPEPETGRESSNADDEQQFNHRLEVCREIMFLLPIIVCSAAAYMFIRQWGWWVDFSQKPVIAGLLGSLWGYFMGCGIVWATRIFGTLAFGREAMGLGDVHLMGAAGAVIGAPFVVVAFFIAPFFGLGWVAVQIFFKKIRQIPYGPFLSLGVLAVIILHNKIFSYLNSVFWH
ncbi:MAG: prepilin peptidase [Planctomycetota bacterium]|jgi:leader peptidase (prepilin peptidase)/N-methyltransferase